MLQINNIREQPAEVIARLKIKNIDATNVIDEILRIDTDRRKTQGELESLLAYQNSLAKQVGDLFKAGKTAEANDLKSKSTALKEGIKSLTEVSEAFEKELHEILVTLPNTPSLKVPAGKTPQDNEVIYIDRDELPVLSKDAMPHWELTSKYDIIDFELGNKLTGAGFPVYKGKGAKLQRALINFF